MRWTPGRKSGPLGLADEEMATGRDRLSEEIVNRYEDPKDAGNGPEHHTGKECIERDCDNPAGTSWSPFWCFECNRARMRKITGQLEALIEERQA